MEIRQYRPAFFEGFENAIAEFNTTDDLRAIPFVQQHTKGDGHHRLSLTDDNTLMAESDEGKRWFVVGFIEGGRPELPRAIFEESTK